MKRVISGSVMVIGWPALICSINKGMTEPPDAITFPYRVPQKMLPDPIRFLERAIITFSAPRILVLTASIGKNSQAGTCFKLSYQLLAHVILLFLVPAENPDFAEIAIK